MVIEIRSEAELMGRRFIHGTGVVIGGTAVVGDVVALDHGMTLAGAGKKQSAHHLTVGDHTIIGRSVKDVGEDHCEQELPYRSPAW